MDILDSFAALSSEDLINRIKLLFSESLWHELTEALLELFEIPAVKNTTGLINLYREFICGFADRINQIKFVKLGIHASSVCASPTESKLFLEELSVYLNDTESKLLADIAISNMWLALGDLP
jgi:hypothetical protein